MRMVIILLCLVSISPLYSQDTSKIFSQSCSQLKDYYGNNWATGPYRSQNGGWLFFLGKATHNSFEDANLLAEGRSIEQLLIECENIPKEAIINERCIEKSNDNFNSFIRISVKQEGCTQLARMDESARKTRINKVLHEKYDQYKLFILNQKATQKGCNDTDATKCNYLGNFYYELGDFELARHYLFRGCESADGSACYNLGKLMKKINPALSIRLMGLSCLQFGYKNSCFESGEEMLSTGNLKMALLYFEEGCNKLHAQSCYKAGLIYKKSATKSEKANELLQIGCLLNYPKACQIVHKSKKADNKQTDRDVENGHLNHLPASTREKINNMPF